MYDFITCKILLRISYTRKIPKMKMNQETESAEVNFTSNQTILYVFLNKRTSV